MGRTFYFAALQERYRPKGHGDRETWGYLERPKLATDAREVLGYPVEVLPFKAPRGCGPELIMISLLPALGRGLGLWRLA